MILVFHPRPGREALTSALEDALGLPDLSGGIAELLGERLCATCERVAVFMEEVDAQIRDPERIAT
jgi:hypothetical protein